MEQNYLARAAKYLAELRRRRLWKRVVRGLGAVVVFCTVYALILPAIAMTRPTTCGREEHTHDASCYAAAEPVSLTAQAPAVQQMCSLESVYADVPDGHAPYALHVHNEFCWQDGLLVCTFPEMPEHTHEQACYTEVRRLICGQEETPPDTGVQAPDTVLPGPGPDVQPTPGGDAQQPGSGEETQPPAPSAPVHQHEDACYEDRLVCGQEAAEGHTHSETCYQLVPGPLACTNTEEGHIHSEACYPPERQLVCGQEAAEGHVHGAACYQRQLICTQAEGQPDTSGYQDLYGSADMWPAEASTLEDGDVPMAEMLPETVPGGHTHTGACYETVMELTCTDPAVLHEHTGDCYNELHELTCDRQVVRAHIHNEGCFTQVELPPAGQPEDAEKEPACGREEHIHDDSCYELQPSGPSQEEQNRWDAIFWGNVVMEASDTVLDAQTSGTWMDMSSMDPAYLEQLRGGAAVDLTRFLDSGIGIQVDSQLYNAGVHGPLDRSADFSILLSWNLSGVNFSADIFDPTSSGTLTYTYSFPQEIVVEDVEKRVLNGADSGTPALTYSIAGNQLTVTYYAPAESVNTRFSLRASWADGVEESARVQWSNSVFTDVTFAKPELTVTKTMGEDGLRAEESGEVWADYTVTVTNSGAVAAREITLTDTLESQRFRFHRGGFENGMDYAVAVHAVDEGAAQAVEQLMAFENYDGGNTLTFPAFDLDAGESRVFRYMARMSSEDRAAVDEAVKTGSAGPEGNPAGETVRNTAVVTCPACGEGTEFTASSQGTYGGPESQHVEDFTQTYSGETFDVTFTVNGDAALPAGMTREKLEAMGGEGLTLDVKPLSENDEEYQTFAGQIAEDAESGEDGGTPLLDQLEVLKLTLRWGSAELDLSGCEVKAEVTPNEALKHYRGDLDVVYASDELEDGEAEEEVLGDEGFGIELKAFTLEEKTTTDAIVGTVTTVEPVEEGAVYLDISQDSEEAVEVEPITFAVENGVAAFSARSVEYPTYTVEFFGKVSLVKVLEYGTEDKDPKYDITVIDTRKLSNSNYLPTNSLGNEGNHIAYLELDVENGTKKGAKGSIRTESNPTQLFKGKSLKFNPNKELNLGMFLILEQFAQEGNAGGLDTKGETNYNLNTAIIIKAETMTKASAIMAESGKTEKEKEEAVNALIAAEGKEIVLQEGQKPSDIKLTSDESEAGGNTYYLPEGATIRLICDPSSSENYTAPAIFYDYDISDGFVYADKSLGSTKKAVTEQDTLKPAWAYVKEQGINQAGNYTGEGSKLAFGNGNGQVPTNLGHIQANGYNINQANGNVFRKCSFGIAALQMAGNQIQYANGIIAPKLFNESDTVPGKTVYENDYQLVFARNGDTYTMTAVRDSKTGENVASDLEQLENTGEPWHATGTPPPFTMYSNQFWPMDAAPSFGAAGHDFRFGSKVAETSRKVFGWYPDKKVNGQSAPSDGGKDAPVSDDEEDHNAYFGMQFKFEFAIPEDYIGPLEYCFFGDDDLWLFLDGKLVCDIGGVHQAAGEYVDLRKHLPVNGANTVGTHTLELFYTERGASGSTCWMQFTLPGLRSVPVDVIPGDGSGNLRIEKKVEGSTDEDATFKFDLTLDKNGTYNCTYYGADGFELQNDDAHPAQIQIANTVGSMTHIEFVLRDKESVLIHNLPKGTTYTISEKSGSSGNVYQATVEASVNGAAPQKVEISQTDKKHSGTISDGVDVVTYTNTFYYALPETGGPGTAGTLWYTYAALPMMAAAVVVYKRSRKKGGTQF